jgi:CBS domain-containing protein
MKIKDCVLIEAFKCNEEDSIVEVAKKLRKISLRHIFVVDKKDYPVGVISVIDINNRVVAEGKNPKEMKAKDIMSKPIEVSDIEEDVEKAYDAMKDKGYVMSPVVKDKKMIGIVSIHQLIKNLKNNKI